MAVEIIKRVTAFVATDGTMHQKHDHAVTASLRKTATELLVAAGAKAVASEVDKLVAAMVEKREEIISLLSAEQGTE